MLSTDSVQQSLCSRAMLGIAYLVGIAGSAHSAIAAENGSVHLGIAGLEHTAIAGLV